MRKFSGDAERYWLQLTNICLWKGSSFIRLDLLKEIFEWNLKGGLNIFFNRYRGMIFDISKQSSYQNNRLFTHEIYNHWRIYFVYQHFYISCPKVFGNSFMFYFGISLVTKAVIMWLGTGVYRAWKTSFDIGTLLKTIILSSRVRFWNL